MRLARLNVYRISAGILVVFAITHTLGGLFGPHRFGVEAEAVFASMKEVQFHVRGATCSFYGFWMGFGLMVTVFLLLSAVVAWHLGGMDLEGRRKAAPLGWALLASQVATGVLSWIFFFPPPAVTACLVVVLLGFERIRDLRLGAARRSAPV